MHPSCQTLGVKFNHLSTLKEGIRCIMKQCLKCGYTRTSEDRAPDYACPKCQAVYAKVEPLVAQRAKEQDQLRHARESGDWTGIEQGTVKREAAAVILSTTNDVPSFKILENAGVVSADYAYAFGAVFESVAGLLRNIAGSGRSGQTIAFLREGRSEVLSALRFAALDVGAQAVVGIRIDYEELSGANNQGIIVIVATGTAVKIARLDA